MLKNVVLKIFSFAAVGMILLGTQSCSKDDDPSDSMQSAVAKKSFTHEFEDDAPYNRTYDLAFIDDNYFEFTATAHGTTGNTIGKIVDTYTIDGNNIQFEYGARGFRVSDSYVKPVSATVYYENENSNKINHLSVTLEFESSKGRISHSKVDFYVSDYKAQTTIEKPKLKEKDFKGTIWKYGDSTVFLYQDNTTSLKYDWKFNEKTQTLILKDPESEETKEIRIIEGDKDSFKSKDGTDWERMSFSDYTKGWADDFLAGEWVNEEGETLVISSYRIGGSLAPSLPADSKMRKYETQCLRFDGNEKGRYYIRYEGKELDRTKYIPMAWDTQKGGSYEITDIFSGRYSVRLKLTVTFNGTFQRVHD